MYSVLKDLTENYLSEATVASPKDVQRVEKIIKSYTQAHGLPYRDFVIRLAGFTNGLAVPKDKPQEIDVRPVIELLANAGYLRRKGDAYVKTSDALSRVISKEYKQTQDERASGIDNTERGRLSMAHADDITPLLDPNRTEKAGQILSKKMQQSYKTGGRYSGFTRDQIKKLIETQDPEWLQLSDSAKSMVEKLNLLGDPFKSFNILKYLEKKSAAKKSYTDIVLDIKQNFGDDYLEALYDLEAIDAIESNKINWKTIQAIRELFDYLINGEFEDIPRDEVIGAFLPKFNTEAKNKSALTHRAINEILLSKDPKYKTALLNISKLTDAGLQYIINSDEKADYKNSASVISIIKFLAKVLNANTADELRAKLAEKAKNREFFKSDNNKTAKSRGRVAEFERLFMV